MLIAKTIEATTDTVAFRANSAAEMQARLTQWFVDNPALFVWDIQLVATGAAPNFLCLLTVGSVAGTGTSLVANTAYVNVIGGVGTLDAPAMAAELGAAVRATAAEANTVFKSVSAGGGFGPNWMAIALRDGPAR